MAKTKVDELREALEKRRVPLDKGATPRSGPDEDTEAEGSLDAELTDKLLRVMADFENYRRRVDRDKQDIIRYANEDLIRELLGGIDHLEQALSHIQQSDSAEARSLALGVELVAKQLTGALEKFGLKPIDAVGQPFDPKLHEALQMVDAEDAAPGTVVAQHRRGYMLNDRLLRAALVDVVRERDNPSPL